MSSSSVNKYSVPWNQSLSIDVSSSELVGVTDRLLSKMSSQKYYYYRRPIGDLMETHRRPTCLSWDLDMLHWRPTGMLVSDGAFRFKIGLRWGMLVSDGSPMGHVGFRWVTNEAYWGLRWVSDGSSMGLRSGMSVSDGDEACWWLRCVSDQACLSPI